jgi:hypothetical protein
MQTLWLMLVIGMLLGLLPACSPDEATTTVPNYPSVQQHAAEIRELYSFLLIGLETHARFATISLTDTAVAGQLLPNGITGCGQDTLFDTPAGRFYRISFGSSQCTCPDGTRRTGTIAVEWPATWPSAGELHLRADSATVNGRILQADVRLAATDSVTFSATGTLHLDTLPHSLQAFTTQLVFSAAPAQRLPGPAFWNGVTATLRLTSQSPAPVNTLSDSPIRFEHNCLYTQQARFPVAGRFTSTHATTQTVYEVRFDADGNTGCDNIVTVTEDSERYFVKLTY